ncbi:MAG: class I SAM-dependent DNA methyltransferase [Verrucomicrobiaceae bacterium]|nr:class I SAM-dependent DNA methyltransferase [Verrucomicrobiaceae bacterium]
MPSTESTASLQAFIQHWTNAGANERANSQSFLLGLTQLLGVPAPSNDHSVGYSFEFPVKVPGGTSTNFLDLYRRGHFVLESKQFTAQKLEQTTLELAAIQAGAAEDKKKSGPVRGTGSWDDAMIRAKGQAERYVRSLPADEPNPPFIIVCDVGHSFEVYADFTQAGKAYLPFPDPRSFRIHLRDLEREDIRERLRLIWTNPTALDPAKVSAEVTREIAAYLAELAKSLEQEGHDPEVVAQFLTRCLFCMFAEDVDLIPDNAFTELLNSVPKDGTGFPELLSTLFREMNTGTGKSISVVLRKKLLQFNGGLFKDDTVLPVNGLQLGLIKQAAKMNWRNVEPAIFGTLLERALVPSERHSLGAHFTPRAYVERLVLPTVIEPLRQEWEDVRAAAITHANRSAQHAAAAAALEQSSSGKTRAGDLDGAKADYKTALDEKKEAAADMRRVQQEIQTFHDRLCAVRVLDPACGSGNFLYVALQHLKILEGEVLDTAAQFGENMKLELETHTIDPHQFLGIELNPRAASIAELVLWIGYLQWHFKIHGQRTPPEPILRAFKNIECRDAVLQYDGDPQPALDEAGQIKTVWDRRSYKTDLITNRDVPDETKRVPLLTYTNPRPAEWPEADFIVGNPPFIGKVKLREDLGDGYAETLRQTYPAVPESADFVLYWWHKAALLVRQGQARRFGLITTNSLRQTFARRVVQMHLEGSADALVQPSKNRDGTAKLDESGRSASRPLSLAFAIPDHPWVDIAEGAAVRIAMTVGIPGEVKGDLFEVASEESQQDGSSLVKFCAVKHERISADLSVGANVSSMRSLRANDLLASTGLILGGRGFVITNADANAFSKQNEAAKKLIFPLRNGEDLTNVCRNMFVLDTNGWSEEDLRTEAPEIYQHLFTHVYAERQQNSDPKLRRLWWLFRRSNEQVRNAIKGLDRFIVTVETSKHRFFTFFEAGTRPEHVLVVAGLNDAYFLGVLSGRIHVMFSLAAGGDLGGSPLVITNRAASTPSHSPCAENPRRNASGPWRRRWTRTASASGRASRPDANRHV